MAQGENYDVVIVGGGVAGLITANRLGQLGKRAIVLEQGREEAYLCNTRYTGGMFHISLHNIMSEESVLRKAIVDCTSGFVADNLVNLLAKECRRLPRWLQDEGMGFIKSSLDAQSLWVIAPPITTQPGLDWKGRGGDVMMRTLERNLIKRGGSLVRGSRAMALVMEGKECRGIVAQQDDREVQYRARAVVLADGGFQGNADLVKRYITPHPERLKQRSAGTGRGDCLQMAGKIGAKIVGVDRFYGHLLSRDAMTNDKLWPHPVVDNLAVSGILVGPTGERFVDEGRGGVYMANMVAQLADPLSSVAIFDHAVWNGPARTRNVPINPFLPQVGGTLLVANDVASLAEKLGMQASRLVETVNAFNSAVAAGTLSSMEPSRTTSKYQAYPIVNPPFYAAPVCAAITATMGGIAINEHAQALAEDGSPIQGLYVAGSATGGLEGGPEIGYVGGLVKSGVTALVAAEHIAGH